MNSKEYIFGKNQSDLVTAVEQYVYDDGKAIMKPHVIDLNIHERINIRSWIVASTDPYARLRRVSVKTHNELLAMAIIAGRPNRYSRKGVSRAS